MTFAEQQALEAEQPGLIRGLLSEAMGGEVDAGTAAAADASPSPSDPSDPDAWVVELAAKVDPFVEPGAREAFNAAMDKAEKTGDSFGVDEAIADYTRALFTANLDYQRSLEGAQEPGGQVEPGQGPAGEPTVVEYEGVGYTADEADRLLEVFQGEDAAGRALLEAEAPGLLTKLLVRQMEQQPDRARDRQEAQREEARGRDALQKQWRAGLRARKRGHH